MRWPWQRQRATREAVFPTVSTTAPPPIPRDRKVERHWRASELSYLTDDWMPFGGHGGTNVQLVHQHLNTLRGRARDEQRNNDYAVRFRQLLQTNVVGPDGFDLRCDVPSRSDPDTIDVPACRAVEMGWQSYANNPDAVDVRGKLDLVGLLDQLIGQMPQDGEILVRRWRTGPWNCALQVIDPVLLDVNFNDEYQGRPIRFGIELGTGGRAVAYWFNEPPSDFANYQSTQRTRVPAADVYHCFLPSLGADQYRGIPWLSTSMYRMHHEDGYEENALVAARQGAAKMAIVKTKTPEGYRGPEDGAGRRIEATEPGMVEHIGPEDDWVSYDPSYPSNEFDAFTSRVLRGVASGLGVSYPTLANDMSGVNYNSLRQDALTERDTWMRLQRWLITQLLRPLARDWMRINIGSRGFPVPGRRGTGGTLSVARVDEYFEAMKFQGRRWQWVDPLKETQAAVLARENNLTSTQAIIRSRGQDPKEVAMEQEMDEEMFGAPEPPPDPQPADEDEAETETQ